MEAYIKSLKGFSREHSVWLTGKCSPWTLQWSRSVFSVTHRATAGTEPGRAGTSAQPISVRRDVTYHVIIPDKCTFLKTSSNCISIPLLPTHTSGLPQHCAALTTLCSNSSVLLLVLNILEISNRLFPSSLKSLRGCPQSLFLRWNTVISISTPRQVFWASNHSHSLPLDSLQLTQIFHKEFSTAVYLQPLQAWTRHKDDF